LAPLTDAFNIKGSLLDPTLDSYHSNITGFIHGDAAFTNITSTSLALNETIDWRHEAMNFMATANMTNMTEKLGSWNWNSSTKVALSVVEKKPQPSDQFPSSAIPIALVHVRLSL
jgi:hypothetical protein